MTKPVYKVRYHIDHEWNKPPEEVCTSVRPGISLVDGKYGYTDILFVASIMLNENGEYGSILLLDTESCGHPSRKMLEAIRDQIEHNLEHHCD